jgi:hypothetical protein
VSRIWDALKQAEKERAGTRAHGALHNEPSFESPDRRRSLRHSYNAQLLVYGSNAEKQPFHEHVETIDANDDGCLFELETSVLEGQRLFLVHSRTQAEQECRIVRVGKRVAGKACIAVSFGSPTTNFWHRK